MNLRDYPHADRDVDAYADTVAADDLAAERHARDVGIAQDVLGDLFDDLCRAGDQDARVGEYGTVGELLTADPELHEQTTALLACANGIDGAQVLAQDAIDRSRGALIRRATRDERHAADMVEQMRRVRPGAFL